MKNFSCLSCCLLALTTCQVVRAVGPGCDQCEPGALCVHLEQRWFRRTSAGRQEIHLPTAHQILAEHAGRCRGIDHVIVRGVLAGFVASRSGGRRGSLRITTGPMHRMAPARGQHHDLLMMGRHHIRCKNSAGRLPSPEASVALCPNVAPAVVVQDVDYSGSGISMTCALCSATHSFASVFALGPAPHLDIVLPVNDTGDSAVHLLLKWIPSEAASEHDCHLKCDEGSQCVSRAQICDGIQDCKAGSNSTSIDENSILCTMLRAERSERLRQRTVAVVAISVAALTLLVLLVAAVGGGLALRRCARARAADKAQQQNLSLVDKSPLI